MGMARTFAVTARRVTTSPVGEASEGNHGVRRLSAPR